MVVCRDEQDASIADNFPNIRRKAHPTGTHFSQIAQEIFKLITEQIAQLYKEGKPSGNIVVYSFHSAVFLLNDQLPDDWKETVTFKRWAEIQQFHTSSGQESRAQLEQQWPAGLPPLDDVIKMLEDALRTRGATARQSAIRMSDIRPLLTAHDSRFSKSNPVATAPNLMSLLV